MNVTITVPAELQDQVNAIESGAQATLSVTCGSPGQFTLNEIEPSDAETESENADEASASADAGSDTTENPAMSKMMAK